MPWFLQQRADEVIVASRANPVSSLRPDGSGSRLWEPKLFWGARGPWPWLESYVRAQKAAVWIERQSFQKSLNRSGASAV